MTFELDGSQRRQFSEALRSAFTLAHLGIMLDQRLDKRLEDIALGDDLEEIAYKVIRRATMEGWLLDLLLAARESRPRNAQLLAFAQQFGLATLTPPRRELEAILNKENSLLDVVKWRELLGQIETQVCQVEINNIPNGTGFLLGPSVVMTNYHVLEKVITNDTPEDVVLRFDYKVMKDGKNVNRGVEYRLPTTDWRIDFSPESPVDHQTDPGRGLPREDELDYVLVRVDGKPGSKPIGLKPEDDAPLRGWVKVPPQILPGADKPYQFSDDSILFIFQHPMTAPLKLDMGAIVGLNSNQTRITYRPNTMAGSSGSPCFDRNWDLVALHHGPGNDGNEGIPFSAIMSLLKKRGLDQELGAQPL
jgi:hypothetical protein